ncbi:unnamed protein product [Vitrella brassicaformis CCMP3155]|uniref:Nudix hydrolase domain-containing protein n=1 Tax=Vitrella brassicaformis (strain CCMP3155) TaxID=1169540 RepID=A0A0G4EVV4_VITBC|nr:unnamed protein product [Vitrella brassicaformis CCMP3155]|eukprot:CEM02859.1 unnamed protein product [Vitrella brassicaformis CCMP3155]
MVPTASLILFAFAASGLQCNAIPASVVGRHVGRHANLNVTIARAGPFAKQQAGLVYKGFYEAASGKREPSNRREEGFMKLAAKAAEKDGGGLVEDAPNATKAVYFDQCHVNKWLSGKAPGWCDPALKESKAKSRHLPDGKTMVIIRGSKLDPKTMAIIRGSELDPKLGHTRRTFSPIEHNMPMPPAQHAHAHAHAHAYTSPCKELYHTSEQTVAESGEMVMGELTAFTIPTIDWLEQDAFPSPLPTWLLADKITRAKYGHSKWYGFPMGSPVKPRHCTGVIGKGGLGKWGPNFAADSLLGRKNPNTEELEILLIKRKDSGDWAFPGGMVDDKEYHKPVITAASDHCRTLIEETLTGTEGKSICDDWSTIQEKPSFQAMMKTLGLEVAEGDIKFACKGGEDKCDEADCEVHISGDEEFGGVETLQSSATPVYAGYVDDPRNTDNAWMESFVLGWLVLDNLAEELDDLPGGSDSTEVAWWPIHKSIPKGSGEKAPMLQDGTLFASHSFFLRAATQFILEENLDFANEDEIREALAKANSESIYKSHLDAFVDKVHDV